MMVSNLIMWLLMIVFSYPISGYLMKKGMALDLSMPLNVSRWKRLKLCFYTPLINVGVMFIYLCYMLHKFERV